MASGFVHWLDAIGTRALFTAITLFVLANGAFVAGVIARRDRALVNRWTSRLLALDLALLGLGLGVPALSAGARATVRMLVPSVRAGLPAPAATSPRPDDRMVVPLVP